MTIESDSRRRRETALRVAVGYLQSVEKKQLQTIADRAGIDRNALGRILRKDNPSYTAEQFEKVTNVVIDMITSSDAFGANYEFVEPTLKALRGDAAPPRVLTPDELSTAFMALLNVEPSLLQNERALRRIRGSWDVFRLSSAVQRLEPDSEGVIRLPDGYRLNRAFLTIDPAQHDSLPRFVFRSRMREGGLQVQKFSGPIIAVQDWVYFLGNVEQDVKMSLMVWPLPDLGDGMTLGTEATGLIITQSTDRAPIATHVLARRIPQKNMADNKEYEVIKKARLDMVGAVDAKEINVLLKDQEIEAFIRRHLEFTYKA